MSDTYHIGGRDALAISAEVALNAKAEEDVDYGDIFSEHTST